MSSHQTRYQAQPPTSPHHHRLHPHHCRYQLHQPQQLHQQQQHQQSRSLSLLLLPRSSVAILCLLIFSSAWTSPCGALDSDPNSVHNKASLTSTNNNNDGDSEKVSPATTTTKAAHSKSKRTILPFHFKLLQDYLHQHGAGSGVSEIKPHARYPVEMLLPPGVLLAADTGSLWRRSRRSAPLNTIAMSLRPESYPRFNPHKMAQADRDMSLPPFPLRENPVAIESFIYPDTLGLQGDLSFGEKFDKQLLKPSKLKSKFYKNRARSLSRRRKMKKLRQKHRIVEALRRRDKAAAAEEALARKHTTSSDLLSPTLSESLSQAFQELNAIQSEKAFVRKHKSKSHKNLIPTYESLENPDINLRREFTEDTFVVRPDKEQNSFKKTTGDRDNLFTTVEDFGPGKAVGEVEWFVSTPIEAETSPLLSASSLDDTFPSAPVEIQDTIVYDGDFGNGQGFVGLGDLSSGTVSGDGFVSSSGSDSFSHTGSFGAPVSFPGESKLVKTSFGSGDPDGFGDFWGEGDFVADDNDCADIETKSCISNLECSCYGFYECSHAGRCVSLTAKPHQSQSPSSDVWGVAAPLGFGLSKRHAIQPGNADAKSKSKLDLADSKLNKPGSRRRR